MSTWADVPCREAPAFWDYDQDNPGRGRGEGERERNIRFREAGRICREECPLLEACSRLRATFNTTGIVAGVVHHPAGDDDGFPHGTERGYMRECRCEPCHNARCLADRTRRANRKRAA